MQQRGPQAPFGVLLIGVLAALLLLSRLAVSLPDTESEESEAAAAVTDGAATAAEPATRPLQDRVGGHRSLRDNPPAEEALPTEPQQFKGYADAPEFSVVSRRDALSVYPCEDCHALMPPNPQPRHLYSPHAAALEHGDGRMWCLDCHAAEDRNQLETLAGESIDFDEAYLLCGQCHYQPQKDWYYGAHGKRVANWQGERVLYNCTHCHNPHARRFVPERRRHRPRFAEGSCP